MTVNAEEKSIALLSSTPLVDMSTAGATTLYTVPTGKVAIITHIVIRSISATLVGGISYSFGNNSATYDNWDSGRTLATLTATTLARILIPTLPADSLETNITICAAASIFKMVITTGSTGAATATIDLFGYLYDA